VLRHKVRPVFASERAQRRFVALHDELGFEPGA
jgi:hypothetical protein